MSSKVFETLPAWAPDYVDMAGLGHMLSVSQKQVQRLLSRGRLPEPDANLSGTDGPKGKRWRRDRVLAWLEARKP